MAAQIPTQQSSLDPMEDYKQRQLAGLFGGKDYVAPQEAGDKPDEYEQLMSRLRGEKEQQDRETEKRRKRAAIFSAIGDGLASLSNLFFTTKYAPSAYNSANSLSEATKRRYDEIQANGDAEFRDKVRERIDDLRRKRAERMAATNAAARQAAADREYYLKEADLLRKTKADEAKNRRARDKMQSQQDVNASTIARNNAQSRYYNRSGGAGNRGGYKTKVTTKKYDASGNLIEQTEQRSNDGPKKEENGKFNQGKSKKPNTVGKGGW